MNQFPAATTRLEISIGGRHASGNFAPYNHSAASSVASSFDEIHRYLKEVRYPRPEI